MNIRRVHVQPISNSEESKQFLALQITFKMLHIFCCLDFGFFEHETLKKRLFWKIATILRSIFMLSLAIIYFDNYGVIEIFWTTFYCSYYLFNILVLICLSPNKTFCQLYRDLQIIDFNLQARSASFQIEKKIIAFVALEFAYSLFSNAYSGTSEISPTIVFFFVTMSIQVVKLCCFFVFYSILCRIKVFSSVLKRKDRDSLSLQFIYKSIVDLTELYKSTLDPLILSSIVTTTFEVMSTILFLVREMKMENSLTFRIEFLTLLTTLTYMFAPALCADYLSTQTEKVLLILHDQLLQERDSSRQRELERFIRYVEARPLRFRVYRVIPLDASLLGMVLSFAVTYLIVIIQFAYK